MAMGSGKKAEAVVAANINVTPMIDVLLVLLIIFMITLPLSRRTWGLIVFPPFFALAAYGGWSFYSLSGGIAESTMGSDILAIGALIFGTTFSLLGLSFLAFDSSNESGAAAEANIVRPGMPTNHLTSDS